MVALCACFTLAACGEEDDPIVENNSAPALTNPYMVSQTDIVMEGQMIYVQQSCQGCHGVEGQGGLGSVLTDEANSTDEFLFKSIADGIPGTIMTAYSGAISEDETWKVVTFIRSLEM